MPGTRRSLPARWYPPPTAGPRPPWPAALLACSACCCPLPALLLLLLLTAGPAPQRTPGGPGWQQRPRAWRRWQPRRACASCGGNTFRGGRSAAWHNTSVCSRLSSPEARRGVAGPGHQSWSPCQCCCGPRRQCRAAAAAACVACQAMMRAFQPWEVDCGFPRLCACGFRPRLPSCLLLLCGMERNLQAFQP